MDGSDQTVYLLKCSLEISVHRNIFNKFLTNDTFKLNLSDFTIKVNNFGFFLALHTSFVHFSFIYLLLHTHRIQATSSRVSFVTLQTINLFQIRIAVK